MAKAPVLHQDFVKSVLNYCPETGEFVWKQRSDVGSAWNTRYAGKAAGYEWRASRRVVYRCIRILDFPFLAHRVAWLYMTGDWPRLVDHVDLDGLNNRWANLRVATRAENAINSELSISNKTGVMGVCLTPSGRFRAFMRVNGKHVHLGHFKRMDDAINARRKAEIDFYGAFSRLK